MRAKRRNENPFTLDEILIGLFRFFFRCLESKAREKSMKTNQPSIFFLCFVGFFPLKRKNSFFLVKQSDQ